MLAGRGLAAITQSLGNPGMDQHAGPLRYCNQVPEVVQSWGSAETWSLQVLVVLVLGTDLAGVVVLITRIRRIARVVRERMV